MSTSKKLVACLLNISEARKGNVVEEIAKAALSINEGEKPIKCSVLNIFSDLEYNRSVITIVASIKHIEHCVRASSIQAYKLIDLSVHTGSHPRLGAVDLIPLHPISENVSLEKCGEVARDLAKDLAEQVPGSASSLFGHAHKALRGLVERRKQVGWFSGQHGIDYTKLKHDIGNTPNNRYGLTGIGSFPYVMNCNVTIETSDLEFGKEIAYAIRGTTSGGLPGVRSMAFLHEGGVEIACNVESIVDEDLKIQSDEFICSFGKLFHVAPAVIAKRIARMALERNIKTQGAAIVGLTPEGAHRFATLALDSGIDEYWKVRRKTMM